MEFESIMQRIGSNTVTLGGKDDLIAKFWRGCTEEMEKLSALSDCLDESIHNSLGARSVRSMASDFTCTTHDSPRRQQTVDFSVCSDNILQAECRARDLDLIASRDWQASEHGAGEDEIFSCSLLLADTAQSACPPPSGEREVAGRSKEAEAGGDGPQDVEELFLADCPVCDLSMSEYEVESLENANVAGSYSDVSADSWQQGHKSCSSSDGSGGRASERQERATEEGRRDPAGEWQGTAAELEEAWSGEGGRRKEEGQVSEDILSRSKEELELELEWTKLALESRRKYLKSKRSTATRGQMEGGRQAEAKEGGRAVVGEEKDAGREKRECETDVVKHNM
eukprot:189436-Hanusia_phi.AAC.1